MPQKDTSQRTYGFKPGPHGSLRQLEVNDDGIRLSISGRSPKCMDFDAVQAVRLSIIEHKAATFFTLALSGPVGTIKLSSSTYTTSVAEFLAGVSDLLSRLENAQPDLQVTLAASPGAQIAFCLTGMLNAMVGATLLAGALSGYGGLVDWVILLAGGGALALTGAIMAWSFCPLRTPPREDIRNLLEALAAPPGLDRLQSAALGHQ